MPLLLMLPKISLISFNEFLKMDVRMSYLKTAIKKNIQLSSTDVWKGTVLTFLCFLYTHYRSRVLVLLVSVAATGLIFLLNSTKWPYLPVSSMCTCGRCLSKDASLLSHHLNPSVEPILSAKTNLSEEAFRWWKVSCNFKGGFTEFRQLQIPSLACMITLK